MNIFHLRQSLVLLSDYHRKCIRGDAVQNAECCLMNHFLLVLRKDLWEGSVSACCTCMMMVTSTFIDFAIMVPCFLLG